MFVKMFKKFKSVINKLMKFFRNRPKSQEPRIRHNHAPKLSRPCVKQYAPIKPMTREEIDLLYNQLEKGTRLCQRK
jgi:hypothetical protein